MTAIDDILSAAPVIPVIVVEDLAHAAPLARALAAGGLPALEVTLRTPIALDAIAAMREAAPDAIVGAGTVTSPAELEAARRAGARFAVSPGAPRRLIEAARDEGLPFLPGCATATEAMELADAGFKAMKLFPAEAVGGAALLKSLAGPLPDLRFCPTGGVGPSNVRDYLALPNVVAVGGSWVCPPDLVRAGEWDAIEGLARDAAALRR